MLSPKITAGSVTTCFWKRAGRMRFRSAELGSDGSKSTSIGWGPVATPIGRVGFWKTLCFLCFSLQKMARDMWRWTKNWLEYCQLITFLLVSWTFGQSFSSTWGLRNNPSLHLYNTSGLKTGFLSMTPQNFTMPKIQRRIDFKLVSTTATHQTLDRRATIFTWGRLKRTTSDFLEFIFSYIFFFEMMVD